MKQCKMKYKGFEFPCNPSVLEIKASRNVSKAAIVGRGEAAFDICANAREAVGEGRFFGEGAFENASRLEALCRSGGAGWLYLPGGECFRAHFKELTIKQDANKNEVFYSFKFIEHESFEKASYSPDCTAVKDGENLFDVAHRCGVSVEALLELNNLKSPFDVKAGEAVALK